MFHKRFFGLLSASLFALSGFHAAAAPGLGDDRIDWEQAPWAVVQPGQQDNRIELAQVVQAIKPVRSEKSGTSLRLRPDKKGCVPFRARLSCSAFEGLYELNMQLTGSDAFIAEDFSFSSNSDGVVVSQPYPDNPLRLVVGGVEPGATVSVSVEGSIAEGGSADGTDLCCNGNLSFRVPGDLDCGGEIAGDAGPVAPEPDPVDPAPASPAPPVVEDRPDPPIKGKFSLRKQPVGSCIASREQQSYLCDFKLTLTNQGKRRYQGPAVISDRFAPANVIGFELRNGAGWRCSAARDGAVTCVNGRLSLAPGASSSLTARIILPALRRGGVFENCAIPGVGPSRSERVRVAQQMMEVFGIASGGVDGRMGPKTRRGLKSLQQRLGLPATGELDDGLFDMLGLALHSDVRQSCVEMALAPIRPPRQEPPVVIEPPVVVPPVLPPVCDRNTTVRRGLRCDCRYPGMNKVSASHCACPRGTDFVTGRGCVKQPGPVGCDALTTYKRGKACFCRYRGMARVSATACACPRGTRLEPGVGCVNIRPVRCDANTTIQKGKFCQCRYPGMDRVSPLACACPSGTKLVAGQGCRRIVLPPQGPVCDLTTIKKGKSCVCRYGNMRKVSPTSCICERGSVFVAGRGCKVVTPNVPNPPKCNLNRTIRKGSQCVCRYPGMKKKNARTCICSNGRKFVRGKGCVGATIANPIPTPGPVLNCDATTVKKGNKCVCRYPNMRKISPVSCGCKKGRIFVAGKGCLGKDLRIRADPKPLIQFQINPSN